MHSRLWILAALTAACTAGDNLPPSNELVSTATEAPGAHCTAGGVAVNSGLDRNDNGTLDPDEVTSTSYVCAGANGTDGANGTNGTSGGNGSNGANALVAIVAEPPGANCAAGGKAIEAGIDTNHDNMLEMNEVTSTTYLCNATNPATIQGSVTVQNTLEAAQLVGVQHITGNLVIDATGLTSIDLTSLVTVDGDLRVNNYSGTALAMPALASVGGSFYVAPQMTSISLPSLVSTGGDLQLSAMAVTLPKLTTVGNTLAIYYLSSDLSLPLFVNENSFWVSGPGPQVVSAPALVHGGYVTMSQVTLDAPVLQDVDTLVLSGVSAVDIPALATATSIQLYGTSLTSFPFAQLTSLTNVYMDNNPNAIQLSSAQTAMGNVQITNGPVALDLPNVTSLSSFVINNSPATTVGLPALQSVTDILQLYNDTSLTTLAFPALTAAHDIYIVNDAALSQCAASSFANGLSATYRTVANNGPC